MGGIVTVSGSTHAELWGGARASSSFSQSISLPGVDGEVVSTTMHVAEDDTGDGRMTIVLAKKREPDDDELIGSLKAEAQALARDSPRFARWLKAHGYLKQTLEEVEEESAAADGAAGDDDRAAQL